MYDHGSKDGSAEVVASEYPWVKLIRGGDFGFAKGNNDAIKQSTGRYVLLLNADTEVMPDTFEVMLDFMDKHPDVGMSTCKVVLAVNGELDKACRRSFPTPWVSFTKLSGLASLFPKSKIFNRYNLGYLPEDGEYEVDSVVGAFQLVRREVVDKIGGLDEDYYMYGEDIDWCYRCKLAGWKVYYYPRTKILHYKGYQSKAGGKRNPKPLYWFYKSMAIFYQKNLAKKYPKALNWLILGSIWALYFVKSGGKIYKESPIA